MSLKIRGILVLVVGAVIGLTMSLGAYLLTERQSHGLAADHSLPTDLTLSPQQRTSAQARIMIRTAELLLSRDYVSDAESAVDEAQTMLKQLLADVNLDAGIRFDLLSDFGKNFLSTDMEINSFTEYMP